MMDNDETPVVRECPYCDHPYNDFDMSVTTSRVWHGNTMLRVTEWRCPHCDEILETDE